MKNKIKDHEKEFIHISKDSLAKVIAWTIIIIVVSGLLYGIGWYLKTTQDNREIANNYCIENGYEEALMYRLHTFTCKRYVENRFTLGYLEEESGYIYIDKIKEQQKNKDSNTFNKSICYVLEVED